METLAGGAEKQRVTKGLAKMLDLVTVSASSDGQRVIIRSGVSLPASANVVAAGIMGYYGSSMHERTLQLGDESEQSAVLDQEFARRTIIRRQVKFPPPFQDREWV